MKTTPRSNRLKLEKSPLVLVLSQIHFAPVLKMSEYIPDIQEAMRKEGLVRFSQEEMQQIVFGPKMTTNKQTRWIFSNRERNEAIVLANDFFVYEVSKYDVFETFLERLLLLFEHVHLPAELTFSSRLGIRYIDLILPNEEHSVNEFIAPCLRGLSATDLSAKKTANQFVVESKTDLGTFFIRSYENSGEQFLPPDLQMQHLNFEKSTNADDEFRILDLDHVSNIEVDFDGDTLKGQFLKLHETTEQGFAAATTPEAIKYWKGEAK